MAKRIPPYVKKKLAEQAQRVAWLHANRVQRFRSPIFVLPEFAESPMLSVIVGIQSEQEVKELATIMNSSVTEQVEWSVVTQSEVEVDNLIKVVQDLRTENDCMVLNRAAAQGKGKIIVLFSSLSSLQGVDLVKISETVRTSEEQVLVASFEPTNSYVGMTRDLFLLARGLDEMFLEVSIAMQDLALRVELLGVRLNNEFTPSPAAKVNVSRGELMVNEGSDNFRKLYFEPH